MYQTIISRVYLRKNKIMFSFNHLIEYEISVNFTEMYFIKN